MELSDAKSTSCTCMSPKLLMKTSYNTGPNRWGISFHHYLLTYIVRYFTMNTVTIPTHRHLAMLPGKNDYPPLLIGLSKSSPWKIHALDIKFNYFSSNVYGILSDDSWFFNPLSGISCYSRSRIFSLWTPFLHSTIRVHICVWLPDELPKGNYLTCKSGWYHLWKIGKIR